MATAIIGQPFTFHALFQDAAGTPVAVTGATIKLFRFNPSGGEVVLTTSSMSAVTGDTGRYTYTYDVPTSMAVGDMLYALMYGVDPGTSATIRVQDEATLVSSVVAGLVARFVQ